MTKESPLSMAALKSSLPETTITSPLYTINYAPRFETCLAMKCVTFNYSQGNMNELPHWLAMMLLAAKVFTCVMVPTILDKTALTGNYANFSRIASKISKYHLLDVLTTFKLMIFHVLHDVWSTDDLFSWKFWGLKSITCWLFRFVRIRESILICFKCQRSSQSMLRDLLEYEIFLD